MLTKSKIQLIREKLEMSDDFKTGLNNLMKKYTIEDSIFVYKNGQVFEATKGYFEVVNEYIDLSEAIRDNIYNLKNLGIRIINNEKFEVGYMRARLCECKKDSKILDINSLSDVRC